MTRVLAIDPGSSASGWVLMDADTGAVLRHGKDANEQLLDWYRDQSVDDEETFDLGDVVLIEAVRPRGQTMYDQTLEAVRWAGRFEEAVARPVTRITRQEVVRTLLGRTNLPNPDARIRALIIDRYGGIGGKAAAVGTVRAPGPLHGVHSDQLAALAVILAWRDGARDIDQERADDAAKKAAKKAKVAA